EILVAHTGRRGTRLSARSGQPRRGVGRTRVRDGWHAGSLSIQTADEHPSKPHPSMIMAALAEAGVGADATVMVGDTSFDMSMARNASVGALGVGWGYHRPDLLVAAGAHHVVSAGEELIAAIDVRLEEQVAAAREAR